MNNRRQFIRDISIAGLGGRYLLSSSSTKLTADSSWVNIANQFFNNPNGVANFNTGSAGVMPIPVYEAYMQNVKSLSEFAPYEVKDEAKAKVNTSLRGLADMLNTLPEEVTYVRNSTEGINHILLGFPFKEGDEVVISEWAYPYVKTIVKRLKQLKSIKVKMVAMDLNLVDNQEIVTRFADQISSKTAMVVVTGITHQFGVKMPVKEICQLAHKHEAKVLVDGAHCVGHISQDIKNLGCDYYVSSMHKWLSAPLGTGLLYIKKGMETMIEPLLPCPHPDEETLHKIEYVGTIAYQNAMTMDTVLDFHKDIGSEKKYNRITSLSKMMISHLSDIPGVRILTDINNPCGIVSFQIAGTESKVIHAALRNKYGIHAKLSGHRRHAFVRASVNLHLLETDIIHFAHSVRKIVDS